MSPRPASRLFSADRHNATDASSGLSRRSVLRAAGVGALLLGLAGCKSAVDGGPSPAGAAGSPRRGGTLSIGQNGDFTPSLLFTVNTSSAISRLVYDTLTAYDDLLRPQPRLAKSWQVAPDGTSVTFQLRDDVRFHTGRPFTADDVVFAVKNLQDPVRAAQLRATAAAVTDFDVKGPHELTLKLTHPVSNLFDLFEFMIIADRETIADALTGKNLVGTGPFTWQSWTPGAQFTLARNPSYWLPGRPYLDGVVVRILPQSDALVSALRTDQVQLTTNLSGRDLAPVKGDKAFVVRQPSIGAGAVYLGVNTSVAPLGDKTVRQALSWAVDRDRILDQALAGYGVASAAPWPKSSPVYSDATARAYTHDPAKAKALLQQAGQSGLTFPMAYLSSYQAIAQMVQFDLEQVGVHTTLTPLDPATFQNQLVTQTLPALWVGAHAFAQVHPSTLAVSAYPFNEARNSSKFSDPLYTQVVRQAWNQVDPDSPAAKDAYRKLTDLLLDEQFVIDLVVLATLEARSARLQGVAENLYGQFVLEDAYLS